jgi:hypothetical protein
MVAHLLLVAAKAVCLWVLELGWALERKELPEARKKRLELAEVLVAEVALERKLALALQKEQVYRLGRVPAPSGCQYQA